MALLDPPKKYNGKRNAPHLRTFLRNLEDYSAADAEQRGLSDV